MAVMLLNTVHPDDCCTRRISKDLRDGKLDTVDTWECPKCGTEWRPTIISLAPGKLVTLDQAQQIRHWEPVPAVAVVHLRK